MEDDEKLYEGIMSTPANKHLSNDKSLMDFRPSRIGEQSTIIGMLIYKGFNDLGAGLYAPVYKVDEKLEFNRLGSYKYNEYEIKRVTSIAKLALKSLMAAGCEFKVKLLLRYKSNGEKDLFGKHSNNHLAEVFFYIPKGTSPDGNIIYSTAKSLNDYIINLYKEESNSIK